MTEAQHNSPAPLWAKVTATFFGFGYSPVAPGTAGSAGAILLCLIVCDLPWWGYAAIALGVFLVGWKSAALVQRELGGGDPGVIVIDEVAGFLVTMFLAPHTAGYITAGFFLFRIFDILKPFPASYFNNQPQTAFTIMIDDVFAGVYAALVLQVLWLILG